mmetsp:Transcript_26554/g.66872  ORF Transcript_26554/g.66872 Transcript_26554/m.66872 type:complete len:340 (+) Transcript_26554:244-1263(+)
MAACSRRYQRRHALLLQVWILFEHRLQRLELSARSGLHLRQPRPPRSPHDRAADDGVRPAEAARDLLHLLQDAHAVILKLGLRGLDVHNAQQAVDDTPLFLRLPHLVHTVAQLHHNRCLRFVNGVDLQEAPYQIILNQRGSAAGSLQTAPHAVHCGWREGRTPPPGSLRQQRRKTRGPAGRSPAAGRAAISLIASMTSPSLSMSSSLLAVSAAVLVPSFFPFLLRHGRCGGASSGGPCQRGRGQGGSTQRGGQRRGRGYRRWGVMGPQIRRRERRHSKRRAALPMVHPHSPRAMRPQLRRCDSYSTSGNYILYTIQLRACRRRHRSHTSRTAEHQRCTD